MSKSIYDTICLFCKQRNYYSNGDESDLTVSDIDSIKCFKCGEIYPVEGFEEVHAEPFASYSEDYMLNTADGFEIKR